MGRCLVAWFPGCSQSRGPVCGALFLLPTGNAERGRRGAADCVAHKYLVYLYARSYLAASISCCVRGKHDSGGGCAVYSCIPKADVSCGLLSLLMSETLVR